MGCISSRNTSVWWYKLKSVRKASFVGLLTIVIYLAVVVATTPALEPFAAMNAAFQLNSVVIFGMGIGIGLQVYLSGKSKMLGCKLGVRNGAFGGNSGSTAATSFFSFFSLVPLGCCGWWLYALSLLPGVVGTGVSAVLIEHSQALAYAGLGIIFGFAGLTALKLRREQGPAI